MLINKRDAITADEIDNKLENSKNCVPIYIYRS